MTMSSSLKSIGSFSSVCRARRTDEFVRPARPPRPSAPPVRPGNPPPSPLTPDRRHIGAAFALICVTPIRGKSSSRAAGPLRCLTRRRPRPQTHTAIRQASRPDCRRREFVDDVVIAAKQDAERRQRIRTYYSRPARYFLERAIPHDNSRRAHLTNPPAQSPVAIPLATVSAVPPGVDVDAVDVAARFGCRRRRRGRPACSRRRSSCAGHLASDRFLIVSCDREETEPQPGTIATYYRHARRSETEIPALSFPGRIYGRSLRICYRRLAEFEYRAISPPSTMLTGCSGSLSDTCPRTRTAPGGRDSPSGLATSSSARGRRAARRGC